ncbi:MAG: cell division protein FtsW, partial [Sphingomonas hengshuiensis]
MRPRGGRAARSPITMWFFDIDRMLLLLALLLIAIGLLAVAAASPAAAVRYSGDNVHVAPLFYFWRQVMWVCLSVPLMIAVSMAPVALARRMGLIGAVAFFAALMLVPYIGVVHNNARRWIDLGVSEFQPSEFLKPCFVVAIAWLLSLREKEPDLPVLSMSFILTGSIACLLMLQPDFGQTVMFAVLWFALLLISGVPMRTLGALLAAAPAGLVAAYLFYDTARNRINAFLFDGTEAAPIDNYQPNMAH